MKRGNKFGESLLHDRCDNCGNRADCMKIAEALEKNFISSYNESCNEPEEHEKYRVVVPSGKNNFTDLRNESCSEPEEHEEYRVVAPFGLKDIWVITTDEEFSNILDDFDLDEWCYWEIGDNFHNFSPDDVPPSIWEIRDLLEGEGYIEISGNSMGLEPGMTLVYSHNDGYGNCIGEEEFVVCRVLDDQLNLFSVDDWNRWTNEGFEEGTTLKELNEKLDNTERFLVVSDMDG